MPRTTIDLDASVLRHVKRIARTEGKSMASVVSELLARALADRPAESPARFEWTSMPLHPRIDIEDKDAVHAALDRE